MGNQTNKMLDARFGSAGRMEYHRPRPDPVGNRGQEYQSELNPRTIVALNSGVGFLRLVLHRIRLSNKIVIILTFFTIVWRM